ncbi:MAG: tyrosine-type recombinase/integrase [Pseudosphingobacterium sp.]|nr:tyrosine-type recombinase/integrase [Pseudosphingobacterium sp.]
MPKTLWKKIELYDAGGDVSKDWYISYYFFVKSSGTYERFKLIQDLNSFKSKTARYKRARIMKKGLVKLLGQLQFDPTQEFHFKESFEMTGYTLSYCIEQYINEKSVSLEDNTIRKYSERIKLFESWLVFQQKGGCYIHEITKTDVTNFLIENQKVNEWSNKTRNHYLTDIRTFFNYFVNEKEGYLEKNPANGIRKLKVVKKGNRPFTPEDFRRILAEAKESDPQLYLFQKFLYYACCRPDTEARFMQRRHFNLETRTMMVPGEISKNDYTQYVPIDDEFYKLLVNELCISDLPGEYYIFGKGFRPGSDPIHRQAYSKRFLVIKKRITLHPDNTLYCFKHTRACHLAEDGTPLYRIKEITRHKTLAALMDYLKDMGVTLEKKAPINSRAI